jgi:type I restriction enzyme S subunit
LNSSEHYALWSVPSFAHGRPEVVSGSEIKSGKLAVEAGDVLVSKINPRINRVWVVTQPKGLPQISSTEWLVARVKDLEVCSPKFLLHCLSAPQFRTWITASASSVTGSHMRAKTEKIMQQEINLPPSNTQERIVEILEEQFSKLDKALEVVNQLEARIASERRSLLHAAFTGELTSQWRKSHV